MPVQVQETDTSVYRNVIIARDFVYVDWSKVDGDALQGAFAFLSSIRVEGAQVWATDQVALSNGAALEAKPSVPISGIPTIRGSIQNLEALDAHGNPTGWSAAVALAFTVVATANVTVPKGQIAAAAAAVNPALGAVIGAALLFAPGNLSLNIGHTNITVPIARDGTGKVTHIGTAARPS
jgi:hypothetical protein